MSDDLELHSPRHRVECNSRNEGLKVCPMTWRAYSPARALLLYLEPAVVCLQEGQCVLPQVPRYREHLGGGRNCFFFFWVTPVRVRL